jgi:hypothetical protein
LAVCLGWLVDWLAGWLVGKIYLQEKCGDLFLVLFLCLPPLTLALPSALALTLLLLTLLQQEQPLW